jgi:tRNA pseudouridine38-40 synthase
VRVRLDLSYDGTGFGGWAAQPGRRTVQGVLEEALGVLLRAPAPRLTVAGRTDAGVHARGQVAHVDLAEDVAHDRLLLRRLNGLLPADVRVRRAAPAPDGFDARFSATWRRYRYRVADGREAVDPLRRTDTLAWPRELDLDLLRQASAPLLGEHDFAAFCRRREGATTVRGAAGAGLVPRRGGVLEAVVQADAFCHSMVRSLVGRADRGGREGRRRWSGRRRCSPSGSGRAGCPSRRRTAWCWRRSGTRRTTSCWPGRPSRDSCAPERHRTADTRRVCRTMSLAQTVAQREHPRHWPAWDTSTCSGWGYVLPDGRELFGDVSFRVGDGAKTALIGRQRHRQDHAAAHHRRRPAAGHRRRRARGRPRRHAPVHRVGP